MSDASALIERARIIHKRLMNPHNAVVDNGIDLKRPKGTRVIEHHPSLHRGSVLDVVKFVGDYYCVDVREILSPCRVNSLVRVRQIAAYLCTKYTGRSLPFIGSEMNRHHTTILHARRTIKQKLAEDKNLAFDFVLLEGRLAAYLDGK